LTASWATIARRSKNPALQREAPDHLKRSHEKLRPERADALAHLATVGDPGVSPGIVRTIAVQAPINVVVVITTIRPVIIIVVTIGKCAAKRDARAEQPPRVLVVVATVAIAAIVAPAIATITVATAIITIVIFMTVFAVAVVVVIPPAVAMIFHFCEKRRIFRL
jgi:hypothetical protein